MPIMFLKIFLVIVAGLQFVIADETYDKVNITYVYQARCPFCLEFVDDQFYSGYTRLSDYIDLELLPVVTVSSDSISCGHGENECFISRAQACAFQRAGVTQKLQVEYLYCTEAKAIQGGTVEDSDIEQCVNTILKDVVSYEAVKTCMDGTESVSLLTEYRATVNEMGVIYVPWISLFGEHDEDKEQALRDDFVGTVCNLLSSPPDACNK